MGKTDVAVTDFKIVWNNTGVNTVCPLCGDCTEPSINFQVQTKDGDAICETCLLEKATDLAEVLYAYFVYKHPSDEMTKMFLDEVKHRQVARSTQPKIVSFKTLEDIQRATDSIALCTSIKKTFLVTKKWYAVNNPNYKENALYIKAIEDGAVIAESEN